MIPVCSYFAKSMRITARIEAPKAVCCFQSTASGVTTRAVSDAVPSSSPVTRLQWYSFWAVHAMRCFPSHAKPVSKAEVHVDDELPFSGDWNSRTRARLGEAQTLTAVSQDRLTT